MAAMVDVVALAFWPALEAAAALVSVPLVAALGAVVLVSVPLVVALGGELEVDGEVEVVDELSPLVPDGMLLLLDGALSLGLLGEAAPALVSLGWLLDELSWAKAAPAIRPAAVTALRK